MRPIRILGIVLIVMSMAFVAIGVLVPHSAWNEYFAFMFAIAGFILATGDFRQFSALTAPRDAHRIIAAKKARMGNE
jgi:hypothetical protein